MLAELMSWNSYNHSDDNKISTGIYQQTSSNCW